MKLLLSIFFVVTILFSGEPLLAADARGITVSPAFQEVILDQEDKEKNFVVSVANDTDDIVTLRLSVFDFGSLDESGGVAFLGVSGDLEKKYSLASWMRPEKDVLTLAPGEIGKVRVTIENRDTLGPGGHYGALTFKTENTAKKNQGESAGDTVSVQQLFSTLIFVKKVGGEIYHLELKASEYQSAIVKFQDLLSLRFENNGNVHLVPRGVVTVMDPFGRIVKKGIINQESALILPETLRVYPVRLSTLAASFIPGRYTMDIAYRYDGKDDFTTTSLQFDFIPLPAILTFLVLIVTGGWYVAKRRRRTSERKALSGSDKALQRDV